MEAYIIFSVLAMLVLILIIVSLWLNLKSKKERLTFTQDALEDERKTVATVFSVIRHGYHSAMVTIDTLTLPESKDDFILNIHVELDGKTMKASIGEKDYQVSSRYKNGFKANYTAPGFIKIEKAHSLAEPKITKLFLL